MSAVIEKSATATNSEAPLTLTSDPPRPLGGFDQVILWANLGISLFGPLTGAAIAAATGSLPLAIGAILLGTLIGGSLLASSAVFGAATGMPASAPTATPAPYAG
ncbi:hypothetical protein [Demetria terragena]|uniref:hypothetical protein n=1 Tax=Demetria terragena TaxID=63959 RepID=UPI00036ACF36|nr:hypothetical protein [Demetria terragena]